MFFHIPDCFSCSEWMQTSVTTTCLVFISEITVTELATTKTGSHSYQFGDDLDPLMIWLQCVSFPACSAGAVHPAPSASPKQLFCTVRRPMCLAPYLCLQHFPSASFME